MGKRIEWVDMAKAIGMIAVVTGHAIHPLVEDSPAMSTMFSAIYWWHMPLFFIVGGFFLRPLEPNWAGVKHFLKRRIIPNVRMYLVAGGLLILASHFILAESWKYTLFYFVRLLYGGRTLNHELSIFWYMTVYIVTLLVVVMIITWVDSVPAQFFIVLMMYMAGMTYTHMSFFQYKYVPWDADIVLVAALYMLCGYYGFKYYPKIPHKALLTAAIVAMYAVLIVRKYQGMLRFSFYFKSHTIANSFLGAFIPLVLSLGVFLLSDFLTSARIFNWLMPLGVYSGAIMYMHKMIFDVVAKVDVFDHWWVQIIFGLTVPILLNILYRQFKNRLKRPQALRE